MDIEIWKRKLEGGVPEEWCPRRVTEPLFTFFVDRMKAMSVLLDDIIHLAEDDQNPLPNLLRKCLRLASELKIERLKLWANKELDGYEGCTVEEIPQYRIVQAHAYGSFAGAFNSWCNKHIIIPAVMDTFDLNFRVHHVNQQMHCPFEGLPRYRTQR